MLIAGVVLIEWDVHSERWDLSPSREMDGVTPPRMAQARPLYLRDTPLLKYFNLPYRFFK